VESGQLVAPTSANSKTTNNHNNIKTCGVDSGSTDTVATAQIVNVGGPEDASPRSGTVTAVNSSASCEVASAAAGSIETTMKTSRTAAAMNTTAAVDTSNSYDYRKGDDISGIEDK
jgi:hypothetical protein